MRRTFNFKAFLIIILVAVTAGVGVFFLHNWQVQRQIQFFLKKSEEASAEKEPQKAREYLERYLLLQPKNIDALNRYAFLLSDTATNIPEKTRAYLKLGAALRQYAELKDQAKKVPDELYRRAAKCARDLGRYQDAELHLIPILSADSKDVELLTIQAECHKGRGFPDKARDVYEKITRVDPSQVKSYQELAELERLSGQLEKAERTLNSMIEMNPRSAEARLTRSRFLSAIGKVNEARKDLEVAMTFTDKDQANADVLIGSAELAEQAGNIDEVKKILETGKTKFPKDVRFYINAARLELRQGLPGRPKAMENLQVAASLVGEDPNAQYMVAKLLLDAGDKAQAVRMIETLRNKFGATPVLEYMRARFLFEEGKIGEAVSILERIKDGLASILPLSLESNLLMATAYEQLGNPDRRLVALERLIKVNPDIATGQLSKAETLVSLGRVTEAMDIYRAFQSKTPAARLPLIRLMLNKELKKPPTQRDWSEVNQLMSSCTVEQKKSKDYHLLTFITLAAAGKFDEVEKAVNQACLEYPKEPAYWITRFSLVGQKPGLDDNARDALRDQVLKEAEQAAGDQLEFRLARALSSSRMPRDKALVLLESLERTNEQWPQANMLTLRVGLANSYTSLGFNKDAKRLLNQCLSANASYLPALLMLTEMAIEEKDDSEATRLINVLKEKEGEEGFRWRWCTLQRLFVKMANGERSFSPEARKLLEELGKVRPGWNQLVTAQGRFLELNGQVDQAIEQYKKAIEAGERDQEIVKRTVQLLAMRRRPEEAKEILSLVMSQNSIDPVYSKLATETSLKSSDSREASLAKAKLAVRADSQDYRDYLWLGNVHWVAEDRSGAEAAFKKALSLGREEAETWANWLVYLIKVGRKQEAEAELKIAESILKTKITYVLTAYYQALELKDKAEEQFIKLVNQYPNDLRMMQSLVSFYFRNGEFAKAEALIKKQIDASVADAPTQQWARRSYALTLAAKPDYPSFKEALSLIEKNLKENPTSPEDLRSRALIMSTRPGPRQEIIKDLEISFSALKPNPTEALLLAQLYEDEGNWEKAKSILIEAASSREGEVPHVLSFITLACIRHKDLSTAAKFLEKLQSKAANQPATVECQAQLLFAQGKPESAIEMLEKLAASHYREKNDPIIFLGVSQLFDKAGQKQAAEKMVKQFVSLASSKYPTAPLALVELYSRHGRVKDALNICDEVWNKLPVGNVAMACVATLHVEQTTQEDIKRVEAKLKATRSAASNDVNVALALADLYNIQKRHGESESLYRQILQVDKDNPIALNNLAWQLSDRTSSYQEAVDMVTRAIDRFGPQGAFLDTRGMIFLRNGKQDLAIRDLEEAVSKSPSDVHWLHLAFAHHQARNSASAEKYWKKAVSLGLKLDKLTQDDRGYYSDLSRSYKP